jgi:hypothetical protein
MSVWSAYLVTIARKNQSTKSVYRNQGGRGGATFR